MVLLKKDQTLVWTKHCTQSRMVGQIQVMCTVNSVHIRIIKEQYLILSSTHHPPNLFQPVMTNTNMPPTQPLILSCTYAILQLAAQIFPIGAPQSYYQWNGFGTWKLICHPWSKSSKEHFFKYLWVSASRFFLSIMIRQHLFASDSVWFYTLKPLLFIQYHVHWEIIGLRLCPRVLTFARRLFQV